MSININLNNNKIHLKFYMFQLSQQFFFSSLQTLIIESFLIEPGIFNSCKLCS